MTTITSRESLASLAQRANTEHAAFETTQSAAIAHAIAAGEALIEAKAQLDHGEWLRWLAEHVTFSDRTARRYMTIAANRTRVADLNSVREAVSVLAEPKPKPVPPTEQQKRMIELSRRFDRVMSDNAHVETDGGMPYVPQGLDPKWQAAEATEHIKRLVALAPSPERSEGLKQVLHALLRTPPPPELAEGPDLASMDVEEAAIYGELGSSPLRTQTVAKRSGVKHALEALRAMESRGLVTNTSNGSAWLRAPLGE